MKTRFLLYRVAAVLFFAALMACDKTSEEEIRYYTVASERLLVTREVWGSDEPVSYPVYLVKEGDATEWTPFDHYISGFSYRAGFEYRISVVVEPFDSLEVFDDAPDKTYTLHQIISCSECRSDGLPEGTVCE